MKVELEGLTRSMYKHRPKVQPLIREPGRSPRALPPGPIQWSGPLRASLILRNLSLSGDFKTDLFFEEEEFRNWLLAYAKGEPEKALRFLAEAQAEAQIALARAEAKLQAASPALLQR